MKKIITFILVMTILASMTITAYATTPKLNVPDMPEISKIKIEVKLDENMEKAVDNHVAKWVKKIDFSKIDFSNIKFSGFGD